MVMNFFRIDNTDKINLIIMSHGYIGKISVTSCIKDQMFKINN